MVAVVIMILGFVVDRDGQLWMIPLAMVVLLMLMSALLSRDYKRKIKNA